MMASSNLKSEVEADVQIATKDGLAETSEADQSTLVEDTASQPARLPERNVLPAEPGRERRRPTPETARHGFAHPRFVLQELLGRGGMGFVYQAEDQLHHTTVALKLLPRANPDALYRFKQEFRTLTNLSHRNLIVLHELFADSEQWFFTMELIDGVSFREFVRPAGFQKWDADHLSRLRSVMRQLVEGVAFLHNAGFLHRDLKPSNVLVTEAGRVVVMDLGLTRVQAVPEWDQPSEAGFCGTIAYMAPEQAAHQPTPASDWYSVGVMLFEALTGRQPFIGATTEVLIAKQQRDAPPPREFVSDIPDELNALCVNLLNRDPQKRSSAAEILRQFAESTDVERPVERPEPADGDFVGRVSELASLQVLFRESRQPQTVCVFVAGDSGIGKTMLIEQFLDRVHRQDSRAFILAGRCYESESVPFKVFDGLLDAFTRRLSNWSDAEVAAVMPRYAGALARVFPVLQRIGPIAAECRRATEPLDHNELRRRAFHALKEFLARLADRFPVVLFVDDIQWGDEDSAELFTALLRPPDTPCLLWIGAHRRENVTRSVFLQALQRRLSESSGITVQRLAIEALPHSDAARLAHQFLARLTEDRVADADAIAREASGNPFFVRELAALAKDIETPGQLTLDSLLLRRFEHLPPQAQRLLEVIAVAGQPLARSCVLTAARHLGVTTDVPLEQLRAERLTRTTGLGSDDTVETYHDRIRETVVRQLSSSDLSRLHGLLAETLQQQDSADAQSVANHWEAAGQPDRAFEWFNRAAEQALRQLAFDQAAGLFGRLLQYPSLKPQDVSRLRRRFADALAASGRGVPAAEQYLTLAQSAGTLEASLDLRRMAANQLLISGRVDDGLSQLRSVLRELNLPVPQSTASTLLRLLFAMAKLRLRGLAHETHAEAEVDSRELLRIDACWSATTGLSIVHTLQGAFYQSLGLSLALKAGEPKRVARSLLFQAAHTATAGTPAAQQQARRLLDRGQQMIRQLDDPYLNAFSILADGIVSYLGGHWSAAAELCASAQRRLRESCGVRTWEFTTSQAFEAWALFYLGRIRQLSETVTAAQHEARDRDNLYALVNSSAFAHAEVLMAEDNVASATEELAEVFKLWNTSGFTVQHVNATSSAAQLLMYQGRFCEAWAMLADAWKRLHSSQLSRVLIARVFHAHIGGRCALALASSNEDARCAGSTPRHFLNIASVRARILRREGVPLAMGFGCLLESGIARIHSQRDRSIQWLRQALVEFRQGELELFAATTQWRLGEILSDVEGQNLSSAAEEWMRGQGIPRPDRLTSVFVP